MITCFNPSRVSLAPSPWFFSRSSSMLVKIFGEKQTAEKELPGFLSECFTQIAVPWHKKLLVLSDTHRPLWRRRIHLLKQSANRAGESFPRCCSPPHPIREEEKEETRDDKRKWGRGKTENEGKKEGKKLNQEGKRRQSQKAQRMREIVLPWTVSCKSGLKKSKKPTRRSLREKADIQARKKQKEDLERKQDVWRQQEGGCQKEWTWEMKADHIPWENLWLFDVCWFWKIQNLGLAKTFLFVFK